MTSNSKVNLKQSNDSQTKIADKTDEKVTDKRSDAKVQTVMSENEMQMQVQYIAASQHFGLLLSLLFRPLIIGVLLSFIGGYLLNSRWFLLGLLLIVASPIAWVACTSLQDRFALYDCGVPRPYQELLQRLPSFIVSPMDAANDLDVEGDQPESESLVKLELEKPILPESITHHHSPQIDREQQDWNPLFSIWNQNDWLSPEDFAALHQLLPWCYAETEVESTEWLNLIIASIWKRMNVYANEQLDQKFGVERSLTCVFGEGNRFAKFKITCATLGDQSPRVNGIRVLRRGVLREEIVLEIEICLDSDAHFQAQGAYDLSFGVRNILFCCRARLTASPLFRVWPAVGAVTIQLIQMPRLHFETTGCLSILNFSPLSYMCKRLLFAWLGRPQQIRLNVAQYLPARARRLTEPRLLIKVDVLEALNLPFGRQRKAMQLLNLLNPLRRFWFGNSGLQVELVLVDQRRRTRMHRLRPHPEWAQNFMFISEQLMGSSQVETKWSPQMDWNGDNQGSLNPRSLKSILQVRLFHIRRADQPPYRQGPTRLVGVCNLPINYFHRPDSVLNGREFDASLQMIQPEVTRAAKKTVESSVIDLASSPSPASSSTGMTDAARIALRISCLPLTDDRNALQSEGADRLSRANWPLAVLTVLVDSASGLETASRHVRAPELRPLVRVSVGNQQMVTSVQERTAQPVWEQTLQFYLYNPKLEEMLVEVVDMYYVLDKGFFSQLMADTLFTDAQQDWLRLSHDGTVIGFFTMPMVDLLTASRMRREGSFQLEGHLEDANIRLQIAIRVIDYCDQVLNNASQPRIPLPQHVLV